MWTAGSACCLELLLLVDKRTSLSLVQLCHWCCRLVMVENEAAGGGGRETSLATDFRKENKTEQNIFVRHPYSENEGRYR